MILLIVGPTGSGKSTALEALAPLGFATVDEDAEGRTDLVAQGGARPRRIAVALDPARNARRLLEDVDAARDAGLEVAIVALDATPSALLGRIVRSGRPPPGADYGMVELGIDLEQDRIAAIARRAWLRVDTTSTTPEELGAALVSAVGATRPVERE